MAKHDKLDLPIAKAERNTDFLVLKYSSTERGKIVDVSVKDTDGLPYDLSGLNLYFVEELYNGQMIVDDGKQENAGKFVTIDLENGKFSYQFSENIYQYDGWAHFKFMKGSNLIDTTAGFAIKIIDDIDSDLDEKSYVAYFESIKKEHQDWLDKAKELLASAQDLNSDNHQIISNCQKALDELTKKHNDLQNQTNHLSETVNSNFTSLTGRIDSLNKEKDQLNTKVDQLTQDKNNLSEDVNNLKNVDKDLKQEIEQAGKVKTVNEKVPDKNGDVQVPTYAPNLLIGTSHAPVTQSLTGWGDTFKYYLSENIPKGAKVSIRAYINNQTNTLISMNGWFANNWAFNAVASTVSVAPHSTGYFYGTFIVSKDINKDSGYICTVIDKQISDSESATVSDVKLSVWSDPTTPPDMTWLPNEADKADKSDVTALASRISALEKKIGGH